MVGQDPDLRADRQIRQGCSRSGADGEDAVLLARLRDDQVRIEFAGQIADETVTLVDPLRRGAAITRQRHPARIDQNPALLRLRADDGGENRDRDVVGGADTDTVHHQIEEHVHAGPHLRDAGQVFGEMGGRRRTDADDRAFMPRRPQRLRGGHSHGPFVLRSRDEGIGRAEAVGFAGMGENAGELDAGLGQGGRDGDELGIGGGQPAAVAVAVDLDEGGWRHTSGAASLAQHRRLFGRIEQHLEVDAGFAETHRPLGGVRRHAHGISHVPKTVLREVLRLRQGGDGDRPGPGRIGAPGDVDGFRGLHMGAQHDAPRGHTRGQTARDCDPAGPCRAGGPASPARRPSRPSRRVRRSGYPFRASLSAASRCLLAE